MHVKAIWPLLRDSYYEWSQDKASRLAAALAYYTAISLAPLLVLSVTLLKFLDLDGKAVVEAQMATLMGQTGRDAAAMMIDAAKQQSGVWATVISFVILVFGASGVFAELQDSLNTIWEVQPDPKAGWWDTIKTRFLSMAMVFGVAFLLLVSLIFSTVLSAVATRIAGDGVVVGLLVDVLLSLSVYSVVFALVFQYLPDVKLRFRDVWIGALGTAALFTFGKYGLTWYLTKGSTASAYGAAGSLAALLIWVYYSAQILFFGAEFTRVYAKKYGSHIEPDRGAVPITEEMRAQQGMVRQHDLQAAKEAEDSLAAKRGGVFTPTGQQAISSPRVVTITRPTVESKKGYALASLGIAAGFVVGAMGLLAGRRYKDEGLDQLKLNDRLNQLEATFGKGRAMKRRVAELNLNQRVESIRSRVLNANESVKRRTRSNETPRWVERVKEMLSK
ncbi:MAG: YihY/virulence factor BrkB family protein [Tepidisphaeraceae bacterium]